MLEKRWFEKQLDLSTYFLRDATESQSTSIRNCEENLRSRRWFNVEILPATRLETWTRRKIQFIWKSAGEIFSIKSAIGDQVRKIALNEFRANCACSRRLRHSSWADTKCVFVESESQLRGYKTSISLLKAIKILTVFLRRKATRNSICVSDKVTLTSNKIIIDEFSLFSHCGSLLSAWFQFRVQNYLFLRAC